MTADDVITSEVTGDAPRKVNIDSFNYLKVLGRGAFGKVLLAELKGTSKIFAVKVCCKRFWWRPSWARCGAHGC